MSLVASLPVRSQFLLSFFRCCTSFSEPPHNRVLSCPYYIAQLLADDVVRRFVQTDMGNTGAKSFGLEKAYVEVKDSVAGTVKLVRHIRKLPTSPSIVARSVVDRAPSKNLQQPL